jgi:predicted transcriptional regulator
VASLTNHGNALLLIARNPRIRIRDIADLLGITERAAQRIVADLASTGYIDRERDGRRNLYHVRTHLPLRLPFQGDLDVRSLLAILETADDADAAPASVG